MTADHASYDDHTAAADSAACAAAAVRAWYDSYSISRAGARVPGSGACTRAARAARLAEPARMTRPASSARRVIGTHEVHGYTGDP